MDSHSPSTSETQLWHSYVCVCATFILILLVSGDTVWHGKYSVFPAAPHAEIPWLDAQSSSVPDSAK